MMLRKHLRFLTLMILMTSGLGLCAQSNDLGLWNTFSFNKGLSKKLILNFDQEVRFRDNITRLSMLYTNVGFTYKINKSIRIAGVYRFINRYKEDDLWGLNHRLYADLILKHRPGSGRLALVYRSRFQWDWRGAGYSAEYGRVPEIYWRNLIKVSYKLNDIVSPYFGTEFRFQLQNPGVPYYNGFDRSRFIGGVDIQLSKTNTLGIYVLRQREWNVVDPKTLNVIGLEYSISID